MSLLGGIMVVEDRYVFICSQCEQRCDFHGNFSMSVAPDNSKDVLRFCKKCRGHNAGLIDVYFKHPYFDETISSQEYPGGKFISSRSEKKYWMDKCKLREGGDRVHGTNNFDPISARHAAESLNKNHPRG